MTQKLPNKIFRACIVTAISFFSVKSYSQYIFMDKPIYEIGLNIGPSNLLGDLGGRYGTGKTFLKDNNIQMTKLMKGAYLTIRPSEFFWINACCKFYHA